MKLDMIDIKTLFLDLAERPKIPTPELDVEHKDIRGRNGSLTKKYAFKDINLPLTFNFLETTQSFKQAFRTAKLIFFTALTLELDDDPGIYYKIKSVSISDADNDIEEYGQFTATFVLAPFAYERTDIVPISGNTTISNPGYEAEPYFKVYVTGTGHLYVGNQTVLLQNVQNFIEIDCEMKNAFQNQYGFLTNLNNKMFGDFPVLPHGDSVVSFDGDITKVDLDMRRRWL